MSKYAHNIVSDADQNTPWYKMMRWMGEGQKILDVGCSSGYFGEKLIKDRHDTVWGMEINAKDAAAARKRGYQAVFEHDLDTLDWATLGVKDFDGIVFADVLEHVKDPLAVLKGAQKVLAKGGFIYISTPNVAHISIRVMLMEGNFDYEDRGILDNTHLRFFTRKNLLQLFYDAGMEVTELDARVDDPPVGQVKRHLEKLGLQPTKAFDALVDSTDARALQYVLAARMAQNPRPAPELSLPARLTDDWPIIAQKMDDDDKIIKALQKELAVVKQTNTELASRLNHIRRHPLSWLAKGAARKITRHASREH